MCHGNMCSDQRVPVVPPIYIYNIYIFARQCWSVLDWCFNTLVSYHISWPEKAICT